MPRSYRMTWQPGAKGRAGRWRKKYRGRSYYFDGGRGKTDREAYEAAVAAWDRLKVTLQENTPKPHQLQYEAAIAKWESVLAWSNKHGETNMAEVAEGKLSDLRSRLAKQQPSPIRLADTFEGQFDRTNNNPKLDQAIRDLASAVDLSTGPVDRKGRTQGRTVIVPIKGSIDPDTLETERAIWSDRIKTLERSTVATESTLEAHILRYLADKRNDVAAGELTAGRLAKLQLQLGDFQDWLGAGNDIAEISGRVLLDYRTRLLTKIEAGEWSGTTASERMSVVKSFVRWLWQTEAISSLPRVLNGNTNSLDISKSSKPIEVFEAGEIASVLKQASDRTKLYMLLMLNTGMTQKDISDLQFSEVDWVRRRITRKRSKTKRFDSVPVVEYVLWQETFSLLKKHQNPAKSGRVLVNENGDPICREEIGKDGKYKKNDNVKNAFDRLKAKTGIRKPLKSLKKTSASLLRGNKSYSGLEDLFLGHAPRKMSDRHYTKPPQELLDDAIMWLRTKLRIPEALKDVR